MRLYRKGELPARAVCMSCGERRQGVLTPTRLGVLCGNCSLLAKARPAIRTLADLQRRAARERRAGTDRRALPRAAPSRRASDRRIAFDPALD